MRTFPPATKAWFAVAASSALIASNSGATTFVDVTDEAEVSYLQWLPPAGTIKGSPQVMTGGAAVADYDGDGWLDLFVTRYRNTDILFKNLGDGTFNNVSAAAGIATVAPTNGASWGDIDNDGDPDLYLSVVDETAGPLRNLLYVNAGDGTFSEQAVDRGAALEAPHWQSGFSTCFGDYDRDGKLDIHTCQWSVLDANNRSVLLRNGDPPGHFSEVTSSAGVDLWDDPDSGTSAPFTTFAFTSRLTDLDRDGWPDLVVVGDYGTSRLFWNNADGTFFDGTAAAAVGGDENGMGLAVGDYDGDGRFDLFVTSIFDARGSDVPAAGWGVTGNRLYRNLGGRMFEDTTDLAGVRDGGWGWGAVFFDYDNDGDLDLAMTNGFESDRTEAETPFNTDPTKLWRNDGGTFTDVTVAEGIADDAEGKGLLVFDYDNDGDLDLFVANTGGTPNLYRNDSSNGHHWLRVKARGSYSNRDGIGAIVSVASGASEQVREIGGGSHYLSQSETIAHFGLGGSGSPVTLSVRWPSGIVQRLQDVGVDQLLEVVEPQSPYDAWMAERFTASELGEPALTSPAANPDGDPYPNAVEFACGLDPRRGESTPPLTASAAGDELHLRFQRRNLPRGVEVVLERSVGLADWEEVPANVPVSVEALQDWGAEAVTLRAPLDDQGAQYRLRVTISR